MKRNSSKRSGAGDKTRPIQNYKEIKAMPKTLRTKQIEEIGYMIYNKQLDEETAVSVNNTSGWTFDTSTAAGSRSDNWLRHEGVVLTPEELQQAITYAESLES